MLECRNLTYNYARIKRSNSNIDLESKKLVNIFIYYKKEGP